MGFLVKYMYAFFHLQLEVVVSCPGVFEVVTLLLLLYLLSLYAYSFCFEFWLAVVCGCASRLYKSLFGSILLRLLGSLSSISCRFQHSSLLLKYFAYGGLTWEFFYLFKKSLFAGWHSTKCWGCETCDTVWGTVSNESCNRPGTWCYLINFICSSNLNMSSILLDWIHLSFCILPF